MFKRVFAWALYDLANTFFAIAMISFHFPVWLIEVKQAKELTFSLTLGASMAAVAILMPLCGAISDATQARMRYLRWTTYACAALTAAIALTRSVPCALVLFAFANIFYHLGTVFYDALLPQLTQAGNRGQTSGIGAAFGYLGSMLGLLFLWPFVRRFGPAGAFMPSAAFFLLFALPSFLLIRDPPHPAGEVSLRDILRAARLRLDITLRTARNEAELWRFLCASFFSACAINTILVFMAVYTKKVLRFTESDVLHFFLFSQSFALAGALFLGRLLPRLGARNTLMAIWLGWIAALGLILASASIKWLWVGGPIIGFCLGATWSTSRVLIIELCKADQLGEMLGLAGLVARVASIIGPILWGLIVWNPAHYRLAVFVQMILLSLGVAILGGVPNRVAGP